MENSLIEAQLEVQKELQEKVQYYKNSLEYSDSKCREFAELIEKMKSEIDELHEALNRWAKKCYELETKGRENGKH